MQDQFNACAEQLSASLPQDSGTFAAGGILTKILALVTALKAGDVQGILKAVYDLLGEFVQDGSTNFGATVTAGMDWSTLLSILGTILSLLGKK